MYILQQSGIEPVGLQQIVSVGNRRWSRIALVRKSVAIVVDAVADFTRVAGRGTDPQDLFRCQYATIDHDFIDGALEEIVHEGSDIGTQHHRTAVGAKADARRIDRAYSRAVDVQLSLLGISIESEGDELPHALLQGRPRHRVVCRISAIDNIQPIGAWIRVHDKGTKTADTEGFTHDRSTTRSIRTDPGGQCQIGNVEVAVVENFNEGGETVEFIGVVRVTEPITRQGCALNNTVVAGTAFVLRVSIEWQEGNGSCRKGQSGMNGRVVVVTVACNQTVGRWHIAKRIVHNGHVTPTEIILVLVEIRDGVRRRRTTVSGCHTACTDPVGSRATPIEIHGRGMTTITTGIQQHVVERRIGFFRESLVEIVNRDESVSGSADLTTRDFGDFSFAQCAVPDADFVDRSIPDFGVPIKLRSDVKGRDRIVNYRSGAWNDESSRGSQYAVDVEIGIVHGADYREVVPCIIGWILNARIDPGIADPDLAG